MGPLKKEWPSIEELRAKRRGRFRARGQRSAITPRGSSISQSGRRTLAPSMVTESHHFMTEESTVASLLKFVAPSFDENRYTKLQTDYLKQWLGFEFPYVRIVLPLRLSLDQSGKCKWLVKEQESLREALDGLPSLAIGGRPKAPEGMFIEDVEPTTSASPGLVRFWLGADSFLAWSGSNQPVGLFIFRVDTWKLKKFQTFNYPLNEQVRDALLAGTPD
ncbi:hypothetical protein NCC49_002457 [Naganishia albida]|nr:hypothetical protein NCC49_002457 [Naganishia albida]